MCRDALLYVPPTYDPARPSPLIVNLHGAGGNGKHALSTFGDLCHLDGETASVKE